MNKLYNAIKRNHNGQEFFLFLLIIVLIVIISLISHTSYSLESFFDLLKSSSAYLIMAIGVLLVMLSGGIDVSFSSIAAVTAYVTIFYQNSHGGGNVWQAFLIAGFLGICLGAVNAVLISLFNLPALIVTLATSNIFFGFLLENAPTAHLSKIPEWVKGFGSGRIIEFTNASGSTYGLSYLAITAVALLIVFSIILKYTGLGRNIYAIGSSREAARRAGISIWRTQFFIYCFVGFLAGIASILNTSLISYVNPFNIQSVTMDVIAAVVLGGASLLGGKGTIVGSFLGVAILFLIKNSLVQLGVPSTWDSVIVGSVLIISIGITMIRSDEN
ncbi:ABC transporter permease [uncultured Sphaerochaeta sp.]|uniref:ABC transporter permease n=1 Tax=uncultured Sphaerochaeta sp. TaxID=886478 RepID=UPI002A0A7AAC|nr:ABC transporter permease [uncultured Sphaerochaeta sp.]